MAAARELTPRQQTLIDKANALTVAQLGSAKEIIEVVFGIPQDGADHEFVAQVAQIIATNFHASMSDANAKA